MNQDTKRRTLKKVSTKSAQPQITEQQKQESTNRHRLAKKGGVPMTPKNVDELRARFAPLIEPFLTDDDPRVRAFAGFMLEALLEIFSEGGLESVAGFVRELRERMRSLRAAEAERTVS